MPDVRPLHRLFGLSWIDFFQGCDVTVELEVDLSVRQQWLDVLIIRKGATPIPRKLPDGFAELAPRNLVTFKSHQEALDGWALCELIGHYVNYRKQSSPSMQELLPDVIVPELATVRVIVVHELPEEDQNAILHLFSAKRDLLRFAREHYRPRSAETSTLLYQLFRAYQKDPAMATQLEEFVRQSLDELLKELPPEKRLEGIPSEELRKRLTPEERLEGLSPEERLEGLSPEKRLEGLSPEKRLEGLSPAELRAALEALQRRLAANGSSPDSP